MTTDLCDRQQQALKAKLGNESWSKTEANLRSARQRQLHPALICFYKPCHCVGRQRGGTGGSTSFATRDQLEPCGAKGNTVRKFAETIDVDLLIDPGRYSCRGPLSWDVHCLGDQVETGESPSRHSGMASILPLVVTGENVLAMRPGNCSGLARSWLSLSRHTALRGYSWDERCKPTTCCVLSRTTVAVFLVRCAYTFDSVHSPHYGHHRV